MTPSDDTTRSRPIRSRRGPRQVRGGARQAHDRGPGRPLRPAAPTSGSRSTRRTRSRPSSSATRVTEDVDVAIIGAGMSGVIVGAKLRDAGPARDRAHRQGRRHRRHLVLEPVPGRDVRRRVVHLHADARGDGLRPDDALRVRRRDPAPPRRDRRRSTAWSTTRCSTPASRPATWDDESSRWIDPHRPRRRGPRRST